MQDLGTAFVLWLMSGRDDHEIPTLESFLRRPAWHGDAACKGEPATFFPEPPRGNYDRARQLCARCPVQPECLATALADPETAGWWGGMSEKDRLRVRREVA